MRRSNTKNDTTHPEKLSVTSATFTWTPAAVAAAVYMPLTGLM